MALNVFNSDDNIYLQWMNDNPTFFVVNTSRENSTFFILHKAKCHHISTIEKQKKGAYTEGDNIKVGSDNLSELKHWFSQNSDNFKGNFKTCGFCKATRLNDKLLLLFPDNAETVSSKSDKIPIKAAPRADTYLFAWNPSKWEWEDLEQCITELTETGKTTRQWSCASHKTIRVGDRVFLERVGVSPKGIVGSGVVVTPPFLSKHWNKEDKEVYIVMIEFDVLLNSDKEPILKQEILMQGELSSQNWTPQSSGIAIKQDVVDGLERLWFQFLTTQKIRNNPFISTDDEEERVYSEGTPIQISLTKYERNPFARKACIKHYGLTCTVCTFNFQEKYGAVGEGYIHVHHLTQISKAGGQYIIDPIKDLRPVCPNCHAMIHRRKDTLSIEEMKSLIK